MAKTSICSTNPIHTNKVPFNFVPLYLLDAVFILHHCILVNSKKIGIMYSTVHLISDCFHSYLCIVTNRTEARTLNIISFNNSMSKTHNFHFIYFFQIYLYCEPKLFLPNRSQPYI